MISIVITAYNVGEYIEQCIKSVLNQTMKDIEVIVVLDKPTDNTEEVVKSIKDSRLKIIENKENIGAGLSRREGIKATKGDYILLVDGDDWLEPMFIEHLYKSAIKTGADVTSGGVTIREPNGYYEVQCVGDCETTGYDKIKKFWGLKVVFMNNRLIKRSMYDKVTYSDRRYIEDTPTIIPILWYANKVVYVDEPGYNYRLNPKSLTHTASWFKDFVYRGLCYCDIVEFFNAHDPGLYEVFDMREYIKTICLQINTHRFTAEEINQFPAQYAELMMRLTNLIAIDKIKYKTNGRN